MIGGDIADRDLVELARGAVREAREQKLRLVGREDAPANREHILDVDASVFELMQGHIKRGVEPDGTCGQVAGLIARRILCYLGAGAELERGQRFGFIRFASRVDHYLPLDAEVKAAIGDKVYAAESVLAWLKPRTTNPK